MRTGADGDRLAVLIEGEAGIGKTRLVEAATAEASAHGFEVLTGTADELYEDRPAGVLVDAFGLTAEESEREREAAADAVGLTEPVRTDPAASRYRVIEAFGALTERLAARTPLVLAVEDLQWADPLSLVVLRAVWRRLAHLPLVLMATYRAAPARAELAACISEWDHDGARRLVLGPLDTASVADLAERRLGAPPGPGLTAVLDKAGGNPLFVHELLDTLRADQLLVDGDAGEIEVASPTVPPSLTGTVLARLGGLGETALQTLRVAAVLGTRFSVRELALMLERPAVDLVGIVEQLVRAGVLTDDGDRLVFRHDVVREAVYLDLPRSLRAALHEEAGRRMAAHGAAPAAVARHYLRAAEPGDPDAVDWLRRGAREQLPHDPAAAAELLERALELAGPDHAQSAALSASRVLALAWAARPEEAEAVAEQMLPRLGDPSARARVQIGLARGRLLHGRLRGALEAFGQALPAVDPQARPELLAERAAAALFRGDLDAARTDADDARAGEEAPSPSAEATATVVAAWEATLRGRLDEGARRARAALRIAATGHGPWTSRVASMAPFCLTRADCLDEALDVAGQALAAAEEAGRANELASLQAVRGVLEFHGGKWDDAEANLSTASTLADEVGVPVIVGAWWPPAIQAQIAARRGEVGRAEAALAHVSDANPEDAAVLGFDYVEWGRALLADARGEGAGALARLQAAWQVDADLGAVSEPPMFAPELVRLAVAHGAHELAVTVADGVSETASRAPLATVESAALQCRGLTGGDPERLVAAVERLPARGRPLQRALAAEDAARHLAAVDAGEAADLATEALQTLEELGAARDAARLKTLLRRLGVRRGARGPRGRPATGWDSLTPTQLEVARLVVEGLTNREIGARLYVSPRTVGTHVSQALHKLGLRSRVELAAEMSRRASEDGAAALGS